LKVVVQRVHSAAVRIDGNDVAKIEQGLLLLVGVAETDALPDVEFVANKCAELRIFQDEQNKMNRSVREVGGEILSVSQFTLLGDTRKGRRPSFITAANPAKAEEYYNYFNQVLSRLGLPVQTGIFGAMMDVELINAGPVTLIIESK
jgi:D-tyrosyl-tRNA(Tyr) deacylase